MQLFRNIGNGRFVEIVKLMHGPLQKNILGRGIALGDLFNTGNMDVWSRRTTARRCCCATTRKTGILISKSACAGCAPTATVSVRGSPRSAPAGGKRNISTAAVL